MHLVLAIAAGIVLAVLVLALLPTLLYYGLICLIATSVIITALTVLIALVFVSESFPTAVGLTIAIGVFAFITYSIVRGLHSPLRKE